MIALSVSDISLSFGTNTILKDVSFAANEGDRIGIIGVNGAGKTSLFRVITGEYSPDSGAVYIQKGNTVGVLEQNADLSSLPGELSALDYMYTAFTDLIELEKEISETERRLASERGEAEMMRLSALLTEKNRQFADRGGLHFRSRCKSMLGKLGFDKILQRCVFLS